LIFVSSGEVNYANKDILWHALLAVNVIEKQMVFRPFLCHNSYAPASKKYLQTTVHKKPRYNWGRRFFKTMSCWPEIWIQTSRARDKPIITGHEGGLKNAKYILIALINASCCNNSQRRNNAC